MAQGGKGVPSLHSVYKYAETGGEGGGSLRCLVPVFQLPAVFQLPVYAQGDLLSFLPVI